MNSSIFRQCKPCPPIGLRLHMLCFAIALLAVATASPVATSQAADSSPAQAILHLANDSFLPGQPLDSDQPNVLRWQSRLFTKPFHFPLSGISTAEFPAVLPRPKPAGEYCIELAGGDVLYGNILEF
jgi:hypothetical protein